MKAPEIPVSLQGTRTPAITAGGLQILEIRFSELAHSHPAPGRPGLACWKILRLSQRLAHVSPSLVDLHRGHFWPRLNDGGPIAALSVPEPHAPGSDSQAQTANRVPTSLLANVVAGGGGVSEGPPEHLRVDELDGAVQRSDAEPLNGVQGVLGSNPGVPTNFIFKSI
jgi:hypothetical protein